MEKQQAPLFEAIDQFDRKQKLEDYKGQKVLLYFYPKDATPGCTLEAQGFQQLYKDFVLNNTQILGISKDSNDSHKKFSEDQKLEFPILSDTDGSIIEKYGVWKEKSMFGKTYMGISRESFLIDEDGNIIKHFDKVNPANHPQEVLDLLK